MILTSDKKLNIEKSVENIRLDTGLSYPENGLLDIAHALGAEVVDADLPDFQGKKVKGYIRWFSAEDRASDSTIPPKINARIYLNEDQNPTVKNFTLAHEIGHLVLHQGTDNFRIDLQDYSEGADLNNEETEANYFAGVLLIPKRKLFSALENAKDITSVSLLFGVPIPALEARMKSLGL